MNKLSKLFEAFLFFLVSIPLGLLPRSISIKAGEKIGLLLFLVWKSRRRIAIQNMQDSISRGCLEVNDPVAAVKENFRNLGRSFSEIMQIRFGSAEKLLKSVEFEGIEHVLEANSRGEGILFITGHCGNWELLAIAMSAVKAKVSVVARPIDNPYINRFIGGIRMKYGNHVIYKKGSLKTVIRTLRNGGSVGILMDQAVTENEGYLLDFLGRRAWTAKAPAIISRKTGAAVLPAFIHRTERGHRVHIYPRIELSREADIERAVVEDTQVFSACVEEYVREHPSEWLWIHRRWKRVKEGVLPEQTLPGIPLTPKRLRKSLR